MQFKTKLGLVDIPNDEVMAASRDIASSAGSPPEIAAPSGSLCCDAIVRCCASCACWRPETMECRYAPGEAAPPEAGCDGWIKGKPSHWLSRVTQRAAPNNFDQPTPAENQKTL